MTKNREVAIRRVAIGLIITLSLLRFLFISADFPIHLGTPGLVNDGVLYSDEGWYSGNAAAFFRTGNFYVEKDMNFMVNLPVLQVLDLITMTIFGPAIVAVRLTTILSFLGVLLLTYLLVRRFGGEWAALLAALLMSSNFFFFAYSRFAIAENSMLLFLLASAWVAISATGRWQYAKASLATVLLMIAILTKTSAIAGAPVLLFLLWSSDRDARARWIRAAIAGFLLLLMLVGYKWFLRSFYPADDQFFNSLNIGMNAGTGLYDFVNGAEKIRARIYRVDKLLVYFFYIGLPICLVLLPKFRRNIAVLASLLFCCTYLGAVAIYNNAQPRYWTALSAPLACVLGCCMEELWRSRNRHAIYRILFVGIAALILSSLVANLFLVARATASPRTTFADAAASVRDTMDKEGAPNDVLLGHIAHSFALYEKFTPINDKFAITPLEERIVHYQPRYLITEGPLEPQKYHIVEEDGSYLRSPIKRYEAITRYYSYEQIDVYNILANHRKWGVHFYRLTPRIDAPWPDGPPPDAR